MTYRKLFLGILLVSTLLLAAGWLLSMPYHHRIMASPGTFPVMLDVGLHRGTIELHWRPLVSPRRFASLSRTPEEDWNLVPELRGHPMGEFRIGRRESSENFPQLAWSDIDYITLPIWVPYLVLMAAAYAWTRRMDRRPEVLRKMRLAEEKTQENAGGERIP